MSSSRRAWAGRSKTADFLVNVPERNAELTRRRQRAASATPILTTPILATTIRGASQLSSKQRATRAARRACPQRAVGYTTIKLDRQGK
eukprot:5024277-Pleurochrysis_carterae.AAC.2